MKKKIFILFLIALITLSSAGNVVLACDKEQTNQYVSQIIFGASSWKASSDDGKKLLDALYLCSEQSGELGQAEIDYLKKQNVSGIPSLEKIKIKEKELDACSHKSWEYVDVENKKKQARRKKLLKNTVNDVFDVGFFEKVFSGSESQYNSFAALLYYSHILSDYLADNPTETKTNVDGKLTSAYSGQPYIDVHGGIPSFTESEKQIKESTVHYSSLDDQKRAGAIFACISEETLDSVEPRPNMVGIKPSGWNNNKYAGVVNSQPPYVYNRCHLLAHSLGGQDKEINLITGTRYMNEEGMKDIEDEVRAYIRKTGNHVLYRVTPVFKGDNKLASGVQIEAFSVEDNGDPINGICKNVFCYNVQPGISINYVTGDTQLADSTLEMKDIIPFATENANKNNPDLIFVIDGHLKVLFEDQKNSKTYKNMKFDIKTISSKARSIAGSNDNAATKYAQLKKSEYKYFEVLKRYVPRLLEKEEFFKSTFK